MKVYTRSWRNSVECTEKGRRGMSDTELNEKGIQNGKAYGRGFKRCPF